MLYATDGGGGADVGGRVPQYKHRNKHSSEHKTSEATTEQATVCKRRRSCRKARTEEFAACCLRRSQCAQGVLGKRMRTAGVYIIRSTNRARRLRSRQQAANDGGRAVRHGRSCLQPAACGGAKAHREPRASAKGRLEHISVSAASASAASQHMGGHMDGRSTSASAQQAPAQRASTPTSTGTAVML